MDELDFKLEIWAAAVQGSFIASTFWNKRNPMENQSVLQFENALYTIKNAISRQYLSHTFLSKLRFKVRSEGNWTMIDALYKATFRALNFL